MRIENKSLIIEGRTEALAVSSVLGGLDQEANRGKLLSDSQHLFASLVLCFEPPLPVERLSTARLTGRRVLDRCRDDEPTEYVLKGAKNIELFGGALALALMPNNLLSRGPRLGKKRFLREKRARPLYEYLRGVSAEES